MSPPTHSLTIVYALLCFPHSFFPLFPSFTLDYTRLTSRISYPSRSKHTFQSSSPSSMSTFSNAHLTFIQQHASNTLSSPPSPNLFTLPLPFESNRPIQRHYEHHPHHPSKNNACSDSSLELRPLMKPNITSALSSLSSDHCRLPSLQNMLASPPPEDRPSNPATSQDNNTHANIASFHHQQQPITKRARSFDAATIVHHHQQQRTLTHQKKLKHRHHDDTRGLRHFSKQVCDTVARKGITTYNEV